MQNLWRLIRSFTFRLVGAVGSLFAIIVAAFVSQNYENWAEKQGIDDLTGRGFPPEAGITLIPYLDPIAGYVMVAVSYFAGPFGIGFVAAACLFSIPDFLKLFGNDATRQDRALRILRWRRMILDVQREAYDHAIKINGEYSPNNAAGTEFVDNKLSTSIDYQELFFTF